MIVYSARAIDVLAFAIRLVLKIANVFLYSSHRVMFLQLAFPIIQGAELVTLRRADVFVSGHVLYLAQVAIQPVPTGRPDAELVAGHVYILAGTASLIFGALGLISTLTTKSHQLEFRYVLALDLNLLFGAFVVWECFIKENRPN